MTPTWKETMEANPTCPHGEVNDQFCITCLRKIGDEATSRAEFAESRWKEYMATTNALLSEKAALTSVVRALPHCSGEWLSGSGGHAVHSGDCPKLATYWSEDDIFAYCDEHLPPEDSYLRDHEVMWIDEAREYNAVEMKP